MRNGLSESYLYDARGRLAQIINGSTRTLIHDGDQLIAAMNLDRNVRWEVVHGVQIDDVLEYESVANSNPGRFVAVKDHRNSIVGWWNADMSQLEQTLEYTPHGRIKVLGPDGAVRCEEEGSGTDCVLQESLPPFGFAGAYRSTRTGIAYMRNRWYAPKLGQFLTHDPLGYIDSYNPYAYAAMDPINFWDPYGLGAGSTANVRENIFDVSASDPIGAVNRLRQAEGFLNDTADAIGFGIKETLEDNRREYRRQMSECEGAECLLAHAGALGNELGAQVLPQSGDEVKLDVVITIATLGWGKVLKEAIPDHVFRLGTRVCSFTAGTAVVMCDGSYQAIETVEEGDWVLARDEETAELSCRQVVDPYANPNRSIILLELRAEDGTTEVIETTDNHPFFVADRGWTRVDELAIGDLVPSSDGAPLTVVGATWTDRIETVYNFGVEGFHTYFVGESEAWVHNCFEGGSAVALKKWNTHRHEFPEFNNAKEYIEAARAFARSPPVGSIWMKRARDGRTMVYDPVTTRFAVLAPDGTTPSTFFKLDATKRPHPVERHRNYASNEEYLTVQAEWK